MTCSSRQENKQQVINRNWLPSFSAKSTGRRTIGARIMGKVLQVSEILVLY